MPEVPIGTTHVVLLKVTYQGGLSPVPGSALAAAVGALEALGGTVTSRDVVFGDWDYIVRVEGLDNIAMARFAYHIAQQGLLSTTTLCVEPADVCLSTVERPDSRLADVEPGRYHANN
ncbi:MAG: GYD domain-containing protein [Deltaproteobacteria bacterium]